MKLRSITSDDIDELVALDQMCFAYGIAYTRVEFLSFLSLKNNMGVLFEQREQIVAFILTTWSYDTAEVITIDVHPDFRRKGFGTRMLHYVETELRNHEIGTECLHVSVENDPALRFYEKEGFKIIDTIKNYYRVAGHAYFMAKLLT
jgi:ribosomal-protein-alanine N-acetyltransferase